MEGLARETATAAKDLPHQYVPNELGWCRVCRGHVVEELHQEWERAQVELATAVPGMRREFGS